MTGKSRHSPRTLRAFFAGTSTRWRRPLCAAAGFVLLGFGLSACGGSKPSPVAPLHPLNDTGVDYCRDLSGAATPCDQAPAQDGNYGRDAKARAGQLAKLGGGSAGFDWTRLDAQGKPTQGPHWHCVRDNHTGLIWEVKSTDAHALNHYQLEYTWWDPDPTRNGGEPGTHSSDCASGVCTTQAFVDAMNLQGWCGIRDWRLPSIQELLSLIVSQHADLAVDTDYFPNTQPSHYWSYQSYAPDNQRAWYQYFSDGSPASTLKSKPMFVRLVYSP